MKTIRAIIGNNFGDEGKGLLVDYFANKAIQEKKKAIVVRFNSGGQCSHTVVTPEGQRFVFGHIGSGTLLGLPTYLSDHVVVNPILFNKEYDDLLAMGHTPMVFVDKDCFITTPFDMILNQLVEKKRGSDRHGSCGIGFGETIERVEKAPNLKAIDYPYPPYYASHSNTYESLLFWTRQRADILGVRLEFEKMCGKILGRIWDNFVDSLCLFRGRTTKVISPIYLNNYDHFIFEGAQGLMLDMDLGHLPHVTRSRTGLPNVLEVCKEINDVDTIDVTYVTRSYITRHGAGPLQYEIEGLPHKKAQEVTNISNPWQGNFRYGLLDYSNMNRMINKDLLRVGAGVRDTDYGQNILSYSYLCGQYKLHLSRCMTCCDQLDDQVCFYGFNGDQVKMSKEVFLSNRCIPHSMSMRSFGPTRNDVRGVGEPN